jgi:amino acid transporter
MRAEDASHEAVPGGAPDTEQQDARDLGKLGYAQQLKRSMGMFSSFAISFSLISITTGIFAGFQLGIRQAGPAVLWSWVVVAVGQFIVALVMADLSTRYPLSGYGYQWTSRLVNPRFGYFAGWLLLLQFMTGFPGVCNALATYMYDFLPLAGCVSVPLFTVFVISVIALLHISGIKLAARVNDFGVIAEIVGALVITTVLLVSFGFDPNGSLSVLGDSTNYATGQSATLGAFALSLLMGAWCLTGFEAAADLAEETHQPRRTVPVAVIGSEASSAIVGFFLLLGFILAIRDLSEVQASKVPLVTILESRFGMGLTLGAMLVVSVAIFACGVASMASTTRLIFSMARDNMLPFSGILKRVHLERKSPVYAIVLVWLVSSAVVLGLEKLEVITSISCTAGYVGYGAIILASLRASHRRAEAEGFSLGRWRVPVCLMALAWTIVVVGALTIPELDGDHLAAKSTLVGVAAGAILYFSLIRGRIRRGEAGPPDCRCESKTVTSKTT